MNLTKKQIRMLNDMAEAIVEEFQSVDDRMGDLDSVERVFPDIDTDGEEYSKAYDGIRAHLVNRVTSLWGQKGI